MTEYCLGTYLLGHCSLYFNTEFSILNIGVFLGIMGVFFTGYQLLSEVNKLRLKYRNTKKITYRLLGIGLGGVLTATLLPFIPGKAIPLIGYSIFREIFVAILCVILIIYNFISANKPIKKIIYKNRLEEISLNYIARGGEHTKAFAIETGFFFNDLFKKTIKGECSYNILVNMLSNNFVDELVKSHPFTIEAIFITYTGLYKCIGKEEKILKEFFQAIFFRSLQSKESFLSREINDEIHKHYNQGKGLLLNTILDDFDFIDKLGLLDGIPYNIKGDDINNSYDHNFILFWNHCIDLYFRNIEQNIDLHKNLYNGMRQISGIIEKKYSELRTNINVFGLNNRIGVQLTKNTEIILKQYGNKRPEYKNIEPTEESLYLGGYGDIKTKNLLDSIAFGMFDCFLASTRIKGGDKIENEAEAERSCCLSIDHILGFGEKNGVTLEIENRLNILFISQITNNLKGWYPMASRAFWNTYGWYIFNGNAKDVILKDFYIRILTIFAEELPKLKEGFIYSYNKDQLQKEYYKNYTQEKATKIIGDLLPENMNYDSVQNKLFYYFGDKSSWGSLDLNIFLKTKKVTIEHP